MKHHIHNLCLLVTKVATFNPSCFIQNMPSFSISEDLPTPGLPLIPILKLFVLLFSIDLLSKLNNSWASLECSLNLDSTNQQRINWTFVLHDFLLPKVIPRANEERSPFKIPSDMSFKFVLENSLLINSTVTATTIAIPPCYEGINFRFWLRQSGSKLASSSNL